MVSSRVGGLGSVLDPHVVGNLTIPMFWAEEAVEAPEAATQMFTNRVYRYAELTGIHAAAAKKCCKCCTDN
jgi:hypothetical protein